MSISKVQIRIDKSQVQPEAESGKLGKDSLRGLLLRAASGSFAIKVIGQGLMFALMVLLARTLGGDQYGIYVYVLAWINILVLLGKMGWDTALMRFVARYLELEDWGGVRGILQRSRQRVLITSLCVSGAGALLTTALSSRLSTDLLTTFYLGWIALPVLALAVLRQAGLRALRRVVLAEFPELVIRPLIVGAGVLLLAYILALRINAATVMGLYLFAVVISFAAGGLWLQRSLPIKVRQASPVFASAEWQKVAMPLFLVSGAHMISMQADTVMLGFLADTTQAGMYSAASRVVTLAGFGVMAANSIAGPLMAGLHARDRSDDLQHVLNTGTKVAAWFAIGCGVLLLLFGREVLGLFGDEFVVAYPALAILMVGQIVNALTGLVGSLMQMCGHHALVAKVIGIAALANIILNAMLIPAFGMYGAATATAITTSAWSIFLAYFAWRRLGLKAAYVWWPMAGHRP